VLSSAQADAAGHDPARDPRPVRARRALVAGPAAG